MAVHWQIPFKSLRSGNIYTVNIYDSSYSGSPVTLKGGAQPFSTQEGDDDDEFTTVRTQSGYIRIVDDGYDADGNAFNWKDMAPNTDTEHPVTLTTGGTVVWQGFMQAQNFGGALYGNPQEREFPVQCPLTVVEGTDVDYDHKPMENFAYLLNQIVEAIPSLTISSIIIQGGADAQGWLLKLIDWQNFVNEDGSGNLTPRFNLYQCLEDVCRFWGWTARTCGQSIYLTCADDSSEQTFLVLTPAQLQTMAEGSATGSTGTSFTTVTLSGDIFANTKSSEYIQRGHNKATVTADGNAADENIMGFADDDTIDEMEALGWVNEQTEGKYVWRTNDLNSFSASFLVGTASSNGSFNLIRIADSISDDGSTYPVLHIKESYSGSSAISFETVYHHAFGDGYFWLHGNIYRKGELFESVDSEPTDNAVGNKTMYMKLGIGKTRATASWWDGDSWVSSETSFKVSIGNKDDLLRPKKSSSSFGDATANAIHIDSALSGVVFLEFMGSDDINDISTDRAFDIEGFLLVFERSAYRSTAGAGTSNANGNFGGQRKGEKIDRDDRREYISTNTNNVRDEYNSDLIFASENDMPFGFGVICNADSSYMDSVTYGSTPAHPEQHLADRVTSFWATSKAKIYAELRTNTIPEITPRHMVTLAGVTGHPLSISHEWRDDVTTLTLLEM